MPSAMYRARVHAHIIDRQDATARVSHLPLLKGPICIYIYRSTVVGSSHPLVDPGPQAGRPVGSGERRRRTEKQGRWSQCKCADRVKRAACKPNNRQAAKCPANIAPLSFSSMRQRHWQRAARSCRARLPAGSYHCRGNRKYSSPQTCRPPPARGPSRASMLGLHRNPRSTTRSL